MESLIGEMLDGRILLDEAMSEFEKLYIQTALDRNSKHLSKTASALGIHRNTLSKRVAAYNGKPKGNGKGRSTVKKATIKKAVKSRIGGRSGKR